MGRSVDYLSHASGVTFVPLDINTEDEDVNEFYWDDFHRNVSDACQKIAPSLDVVKEKWDGRETQIILDNKHCEIGISEYCGLASVSIRVSNQRYDVKHGLAINWINKMWPKMVDEIGKMYTILRKVGTFSNGEGVYEKAN